MRTDQSYRGGRAVMHNNSMKSGRKRIKLFLLIRVLLSINRKRVLLLYTITYVYVHCGMYWLYCAYNKFQAVRIKNFY